MDFGCGKSTDNLLSGTDIRYGSVDTVPELSKPTVYVDPEKEAAAQKKFDKYLVPVALIFIVLAALDRNNLGNARIFGLDEDLGLKSGQFGNIQTLSSLSTFLFGLPWTLAVKRFGAKNALGTAFILWSACTLATAFIHSYSQAVVLRMILCACESGLSPGFTFVFSTIYSQEQTGKRIMTTNLAQCISGAFGGLFAYAVQTMGPRRGIAAWRWLFIIEFFITAVVGGIGLMFIPQSPETAWYLSEEERATMRLKRLRDSVQEEDKLDRKWIKLTLGDPFVYLLGIAFFTSSVAINGFGVFLPTIIAGMGYASIRVNCMTIPVYVLGAISLVTQVYWSDKLKRRAFFIIWSCVPVVIGYLIAVATPNPHAGYAGMFILVLGLYPISTLVVTWVANIFTPDSKRAIGMPLICSIADMSSMISAQLYPTEQGPRYIQGNAISAALTVVAAVLYTASWLLLKYRNVKKAKLIADGVTSNGHEGDRSLETMYIL